MNALATAALALASLTFALGCSGPKPPSRWASGAGTVIDLPRAQWSYRGERIEIRPLSTDYAEVLIDGDPEFFVDRAGRVYDRTKQPWALLEPDGRLVGPNDELLGIVGYANAALPGAANAWLGLMPNGTVVRYGEGKAEQRAAWIGCGASARAMHTCMLVTHVLYFDDEGVRVGEDNMSPSMSPTFGPTYLR